MTNLPQLARNDNLGESLTNGKKVESQKCIWGASFYLWPGAGQDMFKNHSLLKLSYLTINIVTPLHNRLGERVKWFMKTGVGMSPCEWQ